MSKFTLTMEGGKKGLLVNSKDVCAKRFFSRIEFLAQNGKSTLNKRSTLQLGSCKGVKKHKKKSVTTRRSTPSTPKASTQEARRKKGKNSHK